MNVVNVVLLFGGVLGYKDFHRPGYIRHFEPVYYDNSDLLKRHHVTKRSVDEEIHFKFEAYGKIFSTRLSRDNGAFHPSLVVEVDQHTTQYDATGLVKGHLDGDASSIYGIITTTGHFEGKIVTNNDTYYIEKRTDQERTESHSIIYKLSDVTFNNSLTSCYHDRLWKRQMDMTKDTVNQNRLAEMEDYYRSDLPEQPENTNGVDGHMYKEISQDRAEKTLSRTARAIVPEKVTCELFMQADHLFFGKYGEDVDTVIEKLARHVQEVNNIYQSVDFDGSGESDKINFVIKRIKIFTDANETGYKYDGPMDVEYVLDKHSQDNYDDFCLSYLFTYRDFSDGILGLAWVGGEDTAGGVCESHKLYNGLGKSLNTGVVTVLNYGTDVPSAVSHVTFAHEIGHNLGSPHDADAHAECSPGGSEGNYIMYAHATSGNMPNNKKLSSCSIAAIRPVLEIKARSEQGCFRPFIDSVCGNKVVDGTEECDCGWEDECTEGCCNPQVYNVTGRPIPCTKKASSKCSPSEGPCCDDSCQYHDNTTKCRQSSDCLSDAYCSGSSAECPASQHANDTTVCGDTDDFQVCLNGECTGSVCLAYNRVQCQCTGSSDSFDDEQLCHVCCIDGDTCKSSYVLDNIPDAKAVAGSPCNDNRGYCDVFKKCRQVDPSGPLDNIRRLLFSSEALGTLKDWLQKHWYVGIAVGVALISIMGLIVVFCGKSHSSVSPRKPSNPSEYKPQTSTYSESPRQISVDKWI